MGETKFITIAALAILIPTAIGVAKFSSQDELYHNRLGRIATKINKMDTTWKAVNPSRFLNKDLDVVKGMMGTKLSGGPQLPKGKHLELLSLTQQPTSFDSRTAWPNCESIQEVRDQANCGSCWAFGAAEAMSDRICIASGQKDQTRISTEDLTSCCSSCGFGCQGGYPSAAWQYYQERGLVTGDLFGNNNWCRPYSMKPCAHHVKSAKYPACGPIQGTPRCQRKCNSAYSKSYNDDLHKGGESYSVGGESAYMKEVTNHGPFEVAFSVYEDFLTYKTGVYKHRTGRFLGGHAVKLVGYGVEGGTKYWLIANSWNETWGDKGFFKILRGHDECGIESSGVASH